MLKRPHVGLEQRSVDENVHSVWFGFGFDFRLYTATYDDIWNSTENDIPILLCVYKYIYFKVYLFVFYTNLIADLSVYADLSLSIALLLV